MFTLKNTDDFDMASVCGIFNYYIRNSTVTFAEKEYSALEMTAKLLNVRSGNLPFLTVLDGQNGTVSGFAYASNFRAGTACRLRESTIFLAPGYEGKGAGRILYSRLIEEVRRGGDSSGLVAVITADNIHSINFHRSFGFEQCGHMKHAGFKFGKWCDVTLWQLIFDK